MSRPPARQLPLPLPHSPRLSEWPFIEAPSNADALALLRAPANWPELRLVLVGEAGSGKTYLLHRWAAANDAEVTEGVALRFGQNGPPTRALAVDNADAAPEEPLLHVLNAHAEARQPVLLAARAPPGQWQVALPDLASRLRAALTAELGRPDDALLDALFARLLADRQLVVPEPLQVWMRLRLPRQPLALQAAAARLDEAALAAGTGVTRTIAATVVDEIARMWQPVLS